MTKNWVKVNYLSSSQHSINKNIRFKTSILRSDLCDYSDAYIVVKGIINVRGTNGNNRRNKGLTFKNNAPFRSCILNISNAFIDNAENLYIAMAMYNLLDCSDNYFMTSGNLWNYYRDEIYDDEKENENNNKLNNKTITSKCFKYKTKIIGSTSDNENRLNTEVVVPLKYLSNFWRSLDLALINCEIERNFSWSRYYIIYKISITFEAVPNINPVGYRVTSQTTSATFQINNAKFYVPVVTLFTNDTIKFLENMKQRFKRTTSWNKCRSEITTQTKNNNSDYLIDPTFRNINRLFAISFKNGNNDPIRGSFDKYYM